MHMEFPCESVIERILKIDLHLQKLLPKMKKAIFF